MSELRFSVEPNRRPEADGETKHSFYRLIPVPRSGKFSKNDKYKTAKNFFEHAYGSKSKFEDYGGAAEVESHNLTEPNQALQRVKCIVTDRAPSSTLRANALHR